MYVPCQNGLQRIVTTNFKVNNAQLREIYRKNVLFALHPYVLGSSIYLNLGHDILFYPRTNYIIGQVMNHSILQSSFNRN